jgi:hypothetical protein
VDVKYCKNERGIAMVMALVLSLLALTIISALVFFVTQGTSISGFQKRYQTAQEAAKGGIEIFTKEIITETFKGNLTSLISTYASTISLGSPSSCLLTKLTNPTTSWPSSCSNTLIDLKPPFSDITFRLSGVTPQPDFDVFIKIVDTIEGNTDISGLDLEGMGVVESGSGMITPAQAPYMYRVELQAERTSSTNERANFSVLYGY